MKDGRWRKEEMHAVGEERRKWEGSKEKRMRKGEMGEKERWERESRIGVRLVGRSGYGIPRVELPANEFLRVWHCHNKRTHKTKLDYFRVNFRWDASLLDSLEADIYGAIQVNCKMRLPKVTDGVSSYEVVPVVGFPAGEWEKGVGKHKCHTFVVHPHSNVLFWHF